MKAKRRTLSDKVAAAIRKYDIPRGTVANLAGMWPTDFSAWLNGRQTVSPERLARIDEVVSDIVKVLKTAPFRPDLRDPREVLKMIQATNDREAQLVLFSEAESASTASA